MDDNVCVILTAENTVSQQVFSLPANRHLHRSFTMREGEGPNDDGVIGSRDPTPAPDVAEHLIHQLILKFDCPPKNPHMGWSFGRDSSCDVVLSDRSKALSSWISSKHFYIRVSEEGHLFLVDQSTNGTAVSYNGLHEDERRSQESWLISRGGEDRPLADKVTVRFKNSMKFSLSFPRSDDKRVALYEQGQSALPALGVLGLDSGLTTARASRPDTPRAPGSRPALYLPVRRVGSGAFGDVHEVINLRYGTACARKEIRAFVPKEMHKREHDEMVTKFQNEVMLMRTANHENVMRVIHAVLDPQPMLYMPFFEAGSMYDHRDELSEEQTVCILRQLLVGTVYLHGKNIIHRDLKPENVLLDLGGDRIRAVITDLGLSKLLADVDRQAFTRCGTRVYLAPEVGEKGYGPEVDEYAIGMIGTEYVYGFRKHPHPIGSLKWREAQRQDIKDLDEDQLSGILVGLTSEEPQTRFTAEACLEKGCDNGLWRKENGFVVDAVQTKATGLTLRLSTLSPRTRTTSETELETITSAPAISTTAAATAGQPSATDSASPGSRKLSDLSDQSATVNIFRAGALDSIEATSSVKDTFPAPSTPSSSFLPLSPSSIPSSPSQPPSFTAVA